MNHWICGVKACPAEGKCRGRAWFAVEGGSGRWGQRHWRSWLYRVLSLCLEKMELKLMALVPLLVVSLSHQRCSGLNSKYRVTLFFVRILVFAWINGKPLEGFHRGRNRIQLSFNKITETAMLRRDCRGRKPRLCRAWRTPLPAPLCQPGPSYRRLLLGSP